MLKILEGTVANVPPQGGRKHPHQEFIQVDTHNILFICGGAFDGLEKIIERRTDRKGIGFDAIGLDPIADSALTRHNKLFASCDIINIENLKNLDLCGSELFWFGCFPLKIENCDGSPARALAWFE